eukprot:365257-Chlamydomonas_euryale.AAC.9
MYMSRLSCSSASISFFASSSSTSTACSLRRADSCSREGGRGEREYQPERCQIEVGWRPNSPVAQTCSWVAAKQPRCADLQFGGDQTAAMRRRAQLPVPHACVPAPSCT